MNELLGILAKWRLGRFFIVADIEAMFHQVHLKEEDKPYCGFLYWAPGIERKTMENASEFIMTMHIFGAKDSPS